MVIILNLIDLKPCESSDHIDWIHCCVSSAQHRHIAVLSMYSLNGGMVRPLGGFSDVRISVLTALWVKISEMVTLEACRKILMCVVGKMLLQCKATVATNLNLE